MHFNAWVPITIWNLIQQAMYLYHPIFSKCLWWNCVTVVWLLWWVIPSVSHDIIFIYFAFTTTLYQSLCKYASSRPSEKIFVIPFLQSDEYLLNAANMFQIRWCNLFKLTAVLEASFWNDYSLLDVCSEQICWTALPRTLDLSRVKIRSFKIFFSSLCKCWKAF